MDSDPVAQLLIGNSAATVALRQMVSRVATSDAPVLITGHSGVGKEMVARAIHAASPRRHQPYVALNCGAIPADLVETELFGHEKGAFTGALQRRAGHFELANRGTLFLDEIGDMRFDLQVKLLRVLEDGAITRIGAEQSTPIDTRIISATNHDIDRAIDDGRFRQDLFFRLGVILICVPDLATRVADIPALVEHFQRGHAPQHICQFDEGALARLMMHHWPGNVRELRNLVERAGVLCGGQIIDAEAVSQLLAQSPRNLAAAEPRHAPVSFSPAAPVDLKRHIQTLEAEHIRTALFVTHWVISDAARLLKLKRTTLVEKMRKYGISRDCALPAQSSA